MLGWISWNFLIFDFELENDHFRHKLWKSLMGKSGLKMRNMKSSGLWNLMSKNQNNIVYIFEVFYEHFFSWSLGPECVKLKTLNCIQNKLAKHFSQFFFDVTRYLNKINLFKTKIAFWVYFRFTYGPHKGFKYTKGLTVSHYKAW